MWPRHSVAYCCPTPTREVPPELHLLSSMGDLKSSVLAECRGATNAKLFSDK